MLSHLLSSMKVLLLGILYLSFVKAQKGEGPTTPSFPNAAGVYYVSSYEPDYRYCGCILDMSETKAAFENEFKGDLKSVQDRCIPLKDPTIKNGHFCHVSNAQFDLLGEYCQSSGGKWNDLKKANLDKSPKTGPEV